VCVCVHSGNHQKSLLYPQFGTNNVFTRVYNCVCSTPNNNDPCVPALDIAAGRAPHYYSFCTRLLARCSQDVSCTYTPTPPVPDASYHFHVYLRNANRRSRGYKYTYVPGRDRPLLRDRLRFAGCASVRGSFDLQHRRGATGKDDTTLTGNFRVTTLGLPIFRLLFNSVREYKP